MSGYYLSLPFVLAAFLLGVCAKSDPATLFTAAGVLGLLSSLLALDATCFEVTFFALLVAMAKVLSCEGELRNTHSRKAARAARVREVG
jgi:hypothetical protein